jgi:hypothetical protein
MRVRWFGHPWPNDVDRAPICEDDADRVELPPGTVCMECGKKIKSHEQGVVMASVGAIEGSFLISLGYERHWVVAEHLECMLYQTLGYKRMPG